ncbi:MAG: integrase [Halobacteriota archaeon]|nr:integrase [Halobacteriota archaeon]
MRVIMDDRRLQTIEQIRQFLEGNHEVEFEPASGEDKYEWIESVLRRFRYGGLRRTEKGLIRQYLRKVTGYSRAQVSRLIGQYNRRGQLRRKEYRRHRFEGKYTHQDMELLARTDELHGWLSGPATKKILEREWQVFGNDDYRSISRISVSHLYNLRGSSRYRNITTRYTKTKPSVSRIGERMKPDPQGMPGYIRIDSVHQGDRDGEKGVYHINAVDEVTQWENVASVEKISEMYLVPVLEEMLAQFPFTILGFHSDNGSEFINKQVANMLNKLLIHFTKSRPRHSNDNGLVETKNGAVIRKQLGYAYIPQKCAERLNQFHRGYFNPYINFHRPCFFPVSRIDHKGKVKKAYPYEEVRTPYEKLKSLPKAEKYLCRGVTFEALDAIAYQMSDNQFAQRMVKARFQLFREINTSLKRVAH